MHIVIIIFLAVVFNTLAYMLNIPQWLDQSGLWSHPQISRTVVYTFCFVLAYALVKGSHELKK